jgi:AcrR family transcriptional regulator
LTERIERISVSEFCARAEVGRASFYRNYATKEYVVRERAISLVDAWGADFESDPSASPATVFGSLFRHYRENAGFYALPYRNGLSGIMLDVMKRHVGLSADLPNGAAYHKAFFAYGLYGWVCEWIARGMPESAAEIGRMFLRSLELMRSLDYRP